MDANTHEDEKELEEPSTRGIGWAGVAVVIIIIGLSTLYHLKKVGIPIFDSDVKRPAQAAAQATAPQQVVIVKGSFIATMNEQSEYIPCYDITGKAYTLHPTMTDPNAGYVIHWQLLDGSWRDERIPARNNRPLDWKSGNPMLGQAKGATFQLSPGSIGRAEIKYTLAPSL